MKKKEDEVVNLTFRVGVTLREKYKVFLVKNRLSMQTHLTRLIENEIKNGVATC